MAGDVKYRDIAENFLTGTQGVMLVFSLTDHESLTNCAHWVENIRKHVPNVPIVLMGNKDDDVVNRKVTDLEIEEVKKSLGFVYFSVSAKNNTNVAAAFQALVKKAFPDRFGLPQAEPGPVPDDSNGEQKKGCCTIL